MEHLKWKRLGLALLGVAIFCLLAGLLGVIYLIYFLRLD
jgi:hypothetical protein